MPDNLDASSLSASKKDWIARVLGVDIAAPASAKPQVKQASLVTFQKARLAWDGVRKGIQTQLQGLESAILTGIAAHNDDPDAKDKYDPKVAAAGTKRLYTLLDGLDAQLIDKLDEALNASDEARLQFQAEAKVLIERYRSFVASDRLLQQVDDNGFTATAIRPSVEKTLDVLSRSF